MPGHRVIVFIDGSNVYFAQKKMGRWLNWKQTKIFLEGRYNILQYRYYVGRRINDSGMEKYLRKLEELGFVIITKPVKTILDAHGHILEKANFDVEITGDVLTKLSTIEKVVLFSGDSDFSYLAHLIHAQGKKLDVFSSRRTISYELKLSADEYFLIEDFSNLTLDNRESF